MPNHVFVFCKSPEKPGIFSLTCHGSTSSLSRVFSMDSVIVFLGLYAGVVCFSHASFMTLHKTFLRAVLFKRFGTLLDPGAGNALARFTPFCTFHCCDLIYIWCFITVNLSCRGGVFSKCDNLPQLFILSFIISVTSSSSSLVAIQHTHTLFFTELARSPLLLNCFFNCTALLFTLMP